MTSVRTGVGQMFYTQSRVTPAAASPNHNNDFLVTYAVTSCGKCGCDVTDPNVEGCMYSLDAVERLERWGHQKRDAMPAEFGTQIDGVVFCEPCTKTTRNH